MRGKNINFIIIISIRYSLTVIGFLYLQNNFTLSSASLSSKFEILVLI